jgi:hypothetical protein
MVQQQPQGSAWCKVSVAAWLLFDLLAEGGHADAGSAVPAGLLAFMLWQMILAVMSQRVV